MAEQHINRVKLLGEATQGWIAESFGLDPGGSGGQVSLRDLDNILVQKVHAAVERGVQPQAIVHKC
eukprot:3231242-Karenia_brevis.AAC.1